MSSKQQRWFKLWAADYLTDAQIEQTPLEARGILLGMWCLCCIEGSCPVDIDEIARKIRVPSPLLSQWFSTLRPFFLSRHGKLFSKRMVKEQEKSEVARKNAAKRYPPKSSSGAPTNGTADGTADSTAAGSTNGNANGSADCTAQKARELEESKSKSKAGPVETVEKSKSKAFHEGEKAKPSSTATATATATTHEFPDVNWDARRRELKEQARVALQKFPPRASA